jgi:predicted flap endonuclease-1-like 5' DNA nuclease
VSNLRVKFYHEGNSDWIEISIIGDTSTVVRKVQDKDKAEFKADWDAYRKAEPIEVDGTPLTDVKGVGEALARKLKANGIRTAEELAETPDGALPKAVGMGAFEIRKEAKKLVNANREDAIERVIAA